MVEEADLVLIGGGAAGLTAAIFAAQSAPGRSIIVLDGSKTLGVKILVSGGGRCNVTHHVVSAADFNGAGTPIRNIFAAFGVRATIDWFTSLGVELKREETGKLFPVSDSARTVLNALIARCTSLGVELRTASKVTRITAPKAAGDLFSLSINGDDEIRCSAVIFATGGRSLPRSGSDGSGWELIRSVGHTVTPTHAALVPLVLNAPSFHAGIAGISMNVALSTFADGKLIDRRSGSLLWTHFGISGPVVMDASRHFVIAQETGAQASMRCNFLATDQFETVEKWLIQQSALKPKASLTNVLSQRLPLRVAGALLTHCSIDLALPAGQLSRESRRSLVHALTALPLPVQQHRGWNYAEVTAGGVPLSEIDFRTMESKKTPGIFLAGEILDCDGRIGGFNFQWAWTTGYLAGRAAAKRLSSHST